MKTKIKKFISEHFNYKDKINAVTGVIVLIVVAWAVDAVITLGLKNLFLLMLALFGAACLAAGLGLIVGRVKIDREGISIITKR